MKTKDILVLLIVLGVAFGVGTARLAAQATISTGSIQGTIMDQQGGVVPSAKVTITNKATGQKIAPEVMSSGTYSSGALLPGDYLVRVEVPGFKAVEMKVNVQVGVVTSGNISLEVGSSSTVITVETSTVQVNSEQVAVQGVVTTQQIEQLPINGRNFLDLAQLEPGVQIQDGGNFDPTKNGFSSISFGGRFGRTARIEVDGLDISDETVGTTTQNVPLSAIKEFQISQSSLDLSTELTSSGSVNVVTRSGTRNFHGQGFFYWRGDQVSAKLGPNPVPFDRKQYGLSMGGPILNDKLFFYGGWERTRQDLQAGVVLAAPFTALSGSFNSPFFDNQFIGRLDWTVKQGWTIFYRFSFEQNRNDSGFIPNSYQPFSNVDHTPVHAVGFDFTTGRFTHSVRAGYTKFRNGITDAVAGTSITDPAPGISLAIGSSTSCLAAGADAFCSGPNILAPQATFQTNKQFKYDGSFVYRSHIIRYGAGINRILGGGFAKFFGLAPAVRASFNSTTRDIAAAGPFPGGDTNPLNYPVRTIFLGNGQGFFTEKPEFGLPSGGQFDTRVQSYVGDTWKVRPYFTLTGGLRYVRDTGRSDSDLAPIPCSATTLISCTGNLLDQFGPGLGSRVRQPDKNFGGQLGIAWDPFKNGKTSIRAGTGIYYENAVFNNILFDRPNRLAKGLFFGLAFPCPSGTLLLPGNPPTKVDTSSLCGKPIGQVASQITALQQRFQQATQAAGAAANPNFIGSVLANGGNSTGNNFYAPDYRTPYSFQFNIGVQRQLRPGTVMEVNYVRNVGLHSLLAFDSNHVGDSRFLNTAAALNAISATNASFNCPAGPAGINCAIAAGATIVDYAGNGLDSGKSFLGGTPAVFNELTPDTGAAFPGINANVGENEMLFPIGRSVYNALQVSLRSNLTSPLRGIRNLNWQVSYSLSRFESMAQDVDFINNARDFRKPTGRIGPNGLDRTHQLSVGGIMELPLATRISFITHWYTALPANLTLSASGDPGEIFRTDLTGDGTTADILTGTNIGSFGRDVKVGDLNSTIATFNTSFGGKLTPAGQALVNAGLFTAAQLATLGAVIPSVSPAPPGQVGLDAFFTFDLRLSWALKPIKRFEHLTIEPQVGFFNLFNRQNFDSPRQPLSGELNGQVGSANGTTRKDRTNLIGLGSGVFALGAPRSLEFGIKVNF